MFNPITNGGGLIQSPPYEVLHEIRLFRAHDSNRINKKLVVNGHNIGEAKYQ